ncbi:ferritin-like domain-containing protein [Paenibacillus sp. NPDC056579]|uniref:ferritin-like domain-containing protein n=1 Tax=Paenibacillus sp. NPDC056579 TaxID=3345871 RepID=UPI0036A21B6F
MINQSPSADESCNLSVKLQYRDVRRFMEQLQWSVDHTATLVRAYAALIKSAPDEDAVIELDRMMLEEKAIFSLLSAMYMELKGVEPQARPESFDSPTYADGLLRAVQLEREAARHFRDTYLLTPSPRVRDLFFYGWTVSTDHSTGLVLMMQ